MAEPSAPTVVTYAATAGTTVAASFTANEIGIYGGLIIGFGTFLVNWYYQRQARKDRLDAYRKASRRSSCD